MTQTEPIVEEGTDTLAAPAAQDMVLIDCLGITAVVGFQMSPLGYDPMYKEFEPGKPVEMKRYLADYLVSMDPHKFVIRKVEPVAKKQQQPETKKKGFFGK